MSFAAIAKAATPRTHSALSYSQWTATTPSELARSKQMSDKKKTEASSVEPNGTTASSSSSSSTTPAEDTSCSESIDEPDSYGAEETQSSENEDLNEDDETKESKEISQATYNVLECDTDVLTYFTPREGCLRCTPSLQVYDDGPRGFCEKCRRRMEKPSIYIGDKGSPRPMKASIMMRGGDRLKKKCKKQRVNFINALDEMRREEWALSNDTEMDDLMDKMNDLKPGEDVFFDD